MDKKRVGFIGIIIENREKHAPQVNALLTEYGDIIVGRMGIPYHERSVSVITLTVDGSTNEIGALTGKLGMIKGVTVKSAMAKESE
ncbi:MAG TPA: iron-only hydrogenase system regulator [Syntrophales bacterium]|nr:iron-only hydrogenase system regulator [Syntrophales bacterium]HPQ43792.1 iron-only hydrogenase system regulator [Syntrophales bacterium]